VEDNVDRALRLAKAKLQLVREGDKATFSDLSVGGTLPIKWASDIALVSAPTRWLIRGFVPSGRLVLMYGSGGIGKSTFGSLLAAQVTKRKGRVLHVGVEEPFEEFSMRAILAGGDRTMIGQWDLPHKFSTPGHVKDLRRYIQENAIAFVYLDSIYGTIASSVAGDNESVRVRRALEPLEEVAHDTSCTIFGIFHENKAGGSLGAEAMIDIPRVVLHATRKNDLSPLLIRVRKSNYPNKPSHRLGVLVNEMDWTDPLSGETQMEIVDDEGNMEPQRLQIPYLSDIKHPEEDEMDMADIAMPKVSTYEVIVEALSGDASLSNSQLAEIAGVSLRTIASLGKKAREELSISHV
jgi:hypothetical protein